jgi:hypothetical protein
VRAAIARFVRARTSSRGSAWILALALLTATACRSAPCPSPVVIPFPSRPHLPAVTVPEPDPSGRYCLTTEQMNSLAQGIRDIRTYSQQLEESIRIANEAASRK